MSTPVDTPRTVAAAPDVSLRPATDADRDFLVGLYGSTREEELSQVGWAPGQREAFVRMQFDLQDADYRTHNPEGSFDVVEVGGRPAGRLIVDRRPGDIRIVDISLLPDFRGAGTGRHLIGRLLEEAAATDSIVSIHVELHNRAAELYARMGFVVVAEHGVHRRMEWNGP